jgi:hypothetical protein
LAKVVWIIGASFSGSSLLNLLLDSQPTIRGIGEGSQVYRRGPSGERRPTDLAGGPCALCRSIVEECSLYKSYSGGPFYRFNFEHYQCNVLIDSSKSTRMFQAKPLEPEYNYQFILLSKSPPEAVYSWRLHAQWDHWDLACQQLASIPAALDFYISNYRDYLSALDQLKAARIICVQYSQLVADPSELIERLCSILEEPFDVGRLAGRWWETDTHILGGNPAVVAQIVRDNEFAFAVPPDRYLNGKYKDRAGQIFYDSSWQRDRLFLAACLEAITERRADLRDLLPRLGYCLEVVVEEMERLLNLSRG